ncbi:hypothetical protein M9H77_17554 [Catharanthus roseus]|uniref:Uncharacterized protein n=1 Tax=Catharanthus roseus TaxID=4058 RepID=A0ACC0B4Y3_CATRO|nr:hypothetical protein M9H77_17554 [Catharanthus roseus]
MAYSKHERARLSFYKDETMVGILTVEATIKVEMGIGNFSSHAKTFDHIPYDDYWGYVGVNDAYDYCENSPCDYYKGYHDSYGDGDQSCGIEDKGKRMEKEFSNFYGDKRISLSLNPFSLCHEVSLGKSEMLVAYTSLASIFGELCAISLDGNFISPFALRA